MSLHDITRESEFAIIGVNDGRRRLTIQLPRLPPFGVFYIADAGGRRRGTAAVSPHQSNPVRKLRSSPKFRALLLNTTKQPWTTEAVFETGTDLVAGLYELLADVLVGFKINMLIETR